MNDMEIYQVDREVLVELARGLIQFENVNPPGDDRGIADFLARYLERMGVEVRVDVVGDNRRNVVGVWKGEADHPTLLLNGHLDVVAPGQGWTVEPFAGMVKDGQLYGRGAVDMKAGIAAMVSAIQMAQRKGFRPRGTVILAAVADEEVDQTGSRYLGEIGLKADYALVAEPTSLEVMIVHKGRMILEVSTLGKTAHAAMPEHGVNAIEKMGRVLEAAQLEGEALRQRVHPMLGNPTLTITMIQGGSAINSVPDRCQVTLDRRYLPEEKPEAILEGLRKRLAALSEQDEALQWELELLRHSPPLEGATDMPLVSSLRRAIAEVRGEDPGVHGLLATTDAGVLWAELGIPTVVCGPGDLTQAHKPDEHVAIDELVEAAQVYAQVIEELQG